MWKNEPFGQYKSENEINDRRSENEKHFQREDGQVDMFVSSEPINFLENGKWKTIYNTIMEDNNGMYKFSNLNNTFKSFYPGNIQDGFKTVINDQELLEMRNATMYYELNGQKMAVQEIESANGVANGNELTYPNVYGNAIDLLVTQSGGKRKLDYIIRDRAAINSNLSNAQYLVFSEEIILPDGWSAKLENGVIHLVDGTGKIASMYEMPVVFDSKKLTEKHAPNSSDRDLSYGYLKANVKNYFDKEKVSFTDNTISYALEQVENKLTVLTKVRLAYLLDENRVYPVFVDPTLTASSAQTGWHYSNWGGPAGVSTTGAPAGSAITNVNVSFNNIETQEYAGSNWVCCPWTYVNFWNNYTGNCLYYHAFAFGDDVGFDYTCGDNFNYWNCENPNKTWYTAIVSWDGWDYRARWGYIVTVTYETVSAPTEITGTSTICANSSTTLTASGGSASAGSTAITTQWFSGSCGGTLVGTGNPITVSPTTTTTYYVRRVGQCSTTGCASVTVTVNSNVNNPGVISAPASICVGTAANISNITVATTGIPASAGPNYYYYYQRTSAPVTGWVMYDGPTGNLTSALPAAVTGTAGTYLLARNSEFGCAGQVSAPFLNLTVDAAPTLGTLSNPGPIDFCEAGGNFTTAVNVSGQVGSVMWDWGSNNGVWNNNWVAGANSGICCFPKKVSDSDGNADRIRYRVTNGVCTAVTSGTIMIRNRFNEAPTSLESTTSTYCAGSGPANITLTATFPSSINMNGIVRFYSGSCGGTLVGSVSPSANSGSASITISAPASTTTYFVRYEPGAGSGCSNSSCQIVTVTVNPLPTASIASNNASICSGNTATFNLSGTSDAVVTYNINGGENATVVLTGGTATVSVTNATANQTLNLVSINNPTTDCSQSISVSSTVTVSTPVLSTPPAENDYVWTGSTNTAWNNVSNWLQWNGTNYTIPSSFPNSQTANVILPPIGTCVSNNARISNYTIEINNLNILPYHEFKLDNSSAVLKIFGLFANTGTWNTPTSGSTVIYAASGNQSISRRTYSKLQTSGSGIKTLTGTTTVSNVLTIGSNTTFSLSNRILRLTKSGSGMIVNSGTWNPATGTVDFRTSNNQTIPELTYYNLTTNSLKTGGIKTLPNNITITRKLTIDSLSTLNLSSFNIYLTYNDITSTNILDQKINSNLTGSSGAIIYSGSGAQAIAPITFPNLEIQGGNIKQLVGDISVNSNLTISSASLNANSYNVNIGGDWVNNSTFQPGTGTVVFNGSSNQLITGSGTNAFYNLTMNNASGAFLGADITVSNAISLTNGLIDINDFDFNFLSSALSGGSPTSYVRTSGTGELRRNLSVGSEVLFPVGRSTYNPVELNKSGSPHQFGVRVLDVVTANGLDNGPASTGPNVGRMWDITPASGYSPSNGAVSVSLIYANDQNYFVNDFVNTQPADRRMFHFGSAWEDITDVTGQVISGNYTTIENYNFVRQPGVTNFSPFTVSNFNAVLPVELIAFTAQCQDEDVEVKWSTASEFNSQYFSLQLSEDGINWTDLYVADAAGYSTKVLEYTYLHANAARAKNYYRLRQFDNDGTVETYSPIMSNCSSDEAVFMTFPNPSAGSFTVVVNDKLLSGENVLSISDASGKLIQSIAVELDNGSGAFALDGLDLAPGIYYLQLTNGSHTSRVIKHSFR